MTRLGLRAAVGPAQAIGRYARGDYSAERRYLPGTLVIRTTFSTDPAGCRLTGLLAFSDGQRGHDLGLDAPTSCSASVEGMTGQVDLELELAPRRVRL